ncbi:MAG: O-antigen ligase family protein [Verrucomicrobia bacterium]|nr:O-antigen ligase family protein [Verrucomicrobiota bacterium]
MNIVLSIFSGIVVGATILLLTLLPTSGFPRLIAVSALLTAVALVATSLLTKPEATPQANRFSHRIPWVFTALGIFWLLTVIPLPVNHSAVGNPRRAEQNRIVHDAIASVQALELVPTTPTRFAISRNTSGTARYALMMLAAFATALLASQIGRHGKIALLRFLIVLGAAVAFAGYWSLRQAPQGDTLWWVFPVPHSLPGPVACFRNRNHFAAFAALLCPAAIALCLHDLMRLRLIRAATSLIALACLTTGVVVSLSRGAMLAWGFGMLACIALYAIYRQWRIVVALVLLGFIAGAIAFSMLPDDARARLATLRTMEQTDSYQRRVEAWQESTSILRTYPWFGAGANAFRMVYPQHRASTQGAVRTHPENEYVQWVVDCGILGTTLLVLLIFTSTRGALLPTLRDGPTVTVGVAAIGGLAVAAVHATVDYALHIPLYTITAAALAGLIIPPLRPAPTRASRLAFAAPAALLLIVTTTMAFGWGRLIAFDDQGVLARASLRQLTDTMRWSPTSPYAWYNFADRLKNVGTPESSLLARQALQRVAELDPNNYRLMNDVGHAFMALGDIDNARKSFARVKELRDWVQVPDL